MKQYRIHKAYRVVALPVLFALAFSGQLSAAERTAVQTQVPALLYGVAVENPQLTIGVVQPRSSRWLALVPLPLSCSPRLPRQGTGFFRAQVASCWSPIWAPV